jgi:hypothetical protein
MPAAPPHVKVTFSGLLGTQRPAPEIWSFSIAHAIGPVSNSPAPTKAALEAFAQGANAAWRAHVAAVVSSSVFLTRTRAAYISVVNDKNAVGRNADGSFQQADDLFPGEGGEQISIAPPQVALAVTLQSAASGPTGRGRFYLPMPIIDVDRGALTMKEPRRVDVEGRMGQFLTAMTAAAAAQGIGEVVVASRGSVTKGIAPRLRTVTSHRVGRVYDTIRTRRNALPER